MISLLHVWPRAGWYLSPHAEHVTAMSSVYKSGSGQLSWHVALSSTSMPWPTPDPLKGLIPRGKHAAAADVSCKHKRAAGEEHLELEQQISDCSDSPFAY